MQKVSKHVSELPARGLGVAKTFIDRRAHFRTFEAGLHRIAAVTSHQRLLPNCTRERPHFSQHGERTRRPRRSVSLALQRHMRLREVLLILISSQQLRPTQMLSNEPNHHGKGSCQCADKHRQGGRERTLHWREQRVCALRLRARNGRER